ncbi:hypothetical protein [Blastomonas sp. AAP53]|uniref:hypothetical protein n=1 Tax=Blastomonas sp. AAP53 TaxID=1248760 RepID=UPI00126734C5|nr:hypothetical protein [Blastomonas sp. AAP53]
MAFQPFGYHVLIQSRMPLVDAKLAIKRRKKGWFDPKNGARGWILGPFICFWWSGINSQGPMMLGILTGDSRSSQLKARAGSDLNGTIWVTFLTIMILPILISQADKWPQNIQQLVLVGLVFGLGVPLTLWMASKDKREAEPLVKFMRDVLTPERKASRKARQSVSISKKLKIDLSGDVLKGRMTANRLHDSLLDVGPHGFLILSAAPDVYIQTAFKNGGYVIEERKGGSMHFEALRADDGTASESIPHNIFTFDEVYQTLLAFATDAPTPDFLRWQRMYL